MEADRGELLPETRRPPEVLARLLIRLFDDRFGGAAGGKFRVSRKFLRKLAGRRKLPDAYLAQVAEEMFEAGFVFVDCESYSIVLSQKQFTSYRRVTGVAANRVMSHEKTDADAKRARGAESKGAAISDIEKRSVQRAPKIH